MWGPLRLRPRSCTNYSSLHSSESGNLEAVFFSSYLVYKRGSWYQAFLAGTVETGDKNHDVTDITFSRAP